MSYRGPAITYKIRRTTTNNKTGDNYSITVPRIIAQKFEQVFFRLSISGNTILFVSGCKLTINDIIQPESAKVFIGGGPISFK